MAQLIASCSRRDYFIEGIDAGTGDTEVALGVGEKKRITFRLADKATGLDVTKTLVFDGDRYAVDVEVTIKRYEKVLPQAKLRVGPSIGDQGVKHYTFYSVAPEGVVAAGSDKVEVQRFLAQSINENTGSPDRMGIAGPVDWAGVGDTYFAMVAVSSKRLEGLEFQTTQFDYSGNGKPEKRYLINAWVPIPADGSLTEVYAGPKDHYLLTEASQNISQHSGQKR